MRLAGGISSGVEAGNARAGDAVGITLAIFTIGSAAYASERTHLNPSDS